MKSFKRLGVMLDMSRNAVMKPQKVKEFLSILKDAGYDYAMLYLEDTFEVDGEPLFGYLRGGYTKAELKELVAFSCEIGIELIPCVQTLAHLNQIFRYPEYAKINDVADILLVGEERTYQLIDNIFKTVSECFTSKTVNIGMDEAQFVGRGKYYDKHGQAEKFSILLEHLNRVSDLAKKYDFNLLMWSDMFFNRTTDGESYGDKGADKDVIDKIPDNVNLIGWDYYHTEKSFYDEFLARHLKLDKNVWFATSAYASRGFAPNNAFSMRTIKASFEACKEKGVENVLITSWGGNGAECSLFSVLPSLIYASQIAQGVTDIVEIKEKFFKLTGENFSKMLLLDLPNDVGVVGENYGPSKYMLYNDPFLGVYDYTAEGGETKTYFNHAKALKEASNGSKFEYIFRSMSALCEVLTIKFDLGIRTRRCYKERDFKGLKTLVKDYKKTEKLLEEFYKNFKTQWYTDNKPHGFDVQDIRLGGLMQRLKNCRQRLTLFISKKIDKIDELEEELLDIVTGSKNFKKGVIVSNDYKTNSTVNIL